MKGMHGRSKAIFAVHGIGAALLLYGSAGFFWTALSVEMPIGDRIAMVMAGLLAALLMMMKLAAALGGIELPPDDLGT